MDDVDVIVAELVEAHAGIVDDALRALVEHEVRRISRGVAISSLASNMVEVSDIWTCPECDTPCEECAAELAHEIG